MTTTPALRLDGVSQHFGALKAVDQVSFAVEPGARHAVIGPNGAGKSTLFALIAGVRRAGGGRVVAFGEDVTALPEHRRVGRGVVRTFQHSALFLTHTTRENVLFAVQRRAGASWSMLRPLRSRHALLERADELLAEVHLNGREEVLAGSLSHGERRQLEVALALACKPRLLLLDEPAAGMSAAETGRFKALVDALPEETTVMLVEHDLDLVFDIADAVTVLHLGRHLITGTPEEVRGSEQVQSAYLGAADTSDLFTDATGGSE